MKLWLTRMSQWWGYVTVEKSSLTIRPTAGGKKAIEVWTPLTDVIEKRWRERFGKKRIEVLSKTMTSLISKFNVDLPDHLPILGYRLLTKNEDMGKAASTGQFTLPVLISKLLFAFATEFEERSGLSMAICANVLRIVGKDGTRVRDLPKLSGVSKEAIAWAFGRMEESGLAERQAESAASRTKVVELTSKGRDAREIYHQLVGIWKKNGKVRFAEDLLAGKRGA